MMGNILGFTSTLLVIVLIITVTDATKRCGHGRYYDPALRKCAGCLKECVYFAVDPSSTVQACVEYCSEQRPGTTTQTPGGGSEDDGLDEKWIALVVIAAFLVISSIVAGILYIYTECCKKPLKRPSCCSPNPKYPHQETVGPREDDDSTKRLHVQEGPGMTV